MKRVFAFNYVLKGADGSVLDASEKGQPLPFLEGAQQIIPALEEVIKKMNEGEKKTVKLSAKDAYGESDPKMTMEVPKEELSHLKTELGTYLQLQLGNDTKVVRVSKISDTHVTLDGNHPLAGQALEFDVELALIREATTEEVLHGHPHGLHGTSGHGH